MCFIYVYTYIYIFKYILIIHIHHNYSSLKSRELTYPIGKFEEPFEGNFCVV